MRNWWNDPEYIQDIGVFIAGFTIGISFGVLLALIAGR